MWRSGLHSCSTAYCAAWARGCGGGSHGDGGGGVGQISRHDEVAISRLLEAADCSHVRAHLDCRRAHAMLAAHLPAIHRIDATSANATVEAAAVAVAAVASTETAAAVVLGALGERTALCLGAAHAFEILYLPALGGGDDAAGGDAELDTIERQALLAAEAGRRLLLPRMRTSSQGSPPGWCFEPPPPRHELLGACASASVSAAASAQVAVEHQSAATPCERVAARLLRGRRWLCSSRVGPLMLHKPSCDAVAQAWLDATVATHRAASVAASRAASVGPASASSPSVAVCVAESGTNLSAAWGRGGGGGGGGGGGEELLPRTRSGVKAAARAWARTPSDVAPIPRILHQTWPSCELPRRRAAWRERCAQQLGGGWRLWLWSDADNEQLVASAFPWLLPLCELPTT